MSRTENSMRNAGASVAGQLFNNLIRFACRTVFIHTLGKEYLGISSLYSNVLTILNISELGLGSAITYSLYRPLAEHDIAAIQSLMAFFKKAYRVIGLTIFGLGLCLIPVLPKLMSGVTDQVNIYAYYLLYLTQTAVSYLCFAYKATLLVADQKTYMRDGIFCIVQICVNVVQMLILLIGPSFFAYTVAAIAGNGIQNLAVAYIVDQRYPYLRQRAKTLSRKLRRDVFSRVYATALYQISTAIGIATDNIIISAYVSVVAAGMYDNYYIIIAMVQKFMTDVFRSFASSLGNLYLLEGRARNEFIFRCLNLLNQWIVAVCSVGFLTLFQPFITLWIGPEYRLPTSTLFVIVLNFATNYLQNIVQLCKDASGLFVQGKYRAVATVLLNLALSLWLVRRLEIAGVLLGSIISRMMTTWWYDAWLLYRRGFGKSPAGYYLESILTLGVILIAYALMSLVPVAGTTWGWLILRGVICVMMINGIYLLIYGKSKEFRCLLRKAGELRQKIRQTVETMRKI